MYLYRLDYVPKMSILPINIINSICEWTVDTETNWYPFFCPNTNKLRWKVNKYSKKWLETGEIIFNDKYKNTIISGTVRLYNISTKEILYGEYCSVILKIENKFRTSIELYIKMELHNEEQYGAKMDFYLYGENELDLRLSEYHVLYNSNILYGTIVDCNINMMNYNMNIEIEQIQMVEL